MSAVAEPTTSFRNNDDDGAGGGTAGTGIGADAVGDAESGDAVTTNITTNLPPDPELKAGLLKPIPETTHVERIAGGAACAAIITALAAMIVESTGVVVVAGILSMVVGPYAYYQQTRLTDIKTLQETEKAVKQEVDKLQEENKRLADNVTDLTTSVQHLDDVQQALDVITQTQGQSIDEFSKQVENNKKILKQMKQNLKASILQNLLSVVLRSDTDGDFTISENETDDLIRRLNNIAGLKLYESRFRNAITGQSIPAVMDIIKNLLRDDVPDDEIIFELEKRQ